MKQVKRNPTVRFIQFRLTRRSVIMDRSFPKIILSEHSQHITTTPLDFEAQNKMLPQSTQSQLPQLQALGSNRFSIQFSHPEYLRKHQSSLIPDFDWPYIFISKRTSVNLQISQPQLKQCEVASVSYEQVFCQLLKLVFGLDLQKFKCQLLTRNYLSVLNQFCFRGSYFFQIIFRLSHLEARYRPFLLVLLGCGVKLSKEFLPELISYKDSVLASLFFSHQYKQNHEKLKQGLTSLSDEIKGVQDFQFEIQWKLLNSDQNQTLLNQDTILISKRYNSLRIDFNYSSLHDRRVRPMSVFFRGSAYMTSHLNQAFYQLQEELDQDELKLLMTEILDRPLQRSRVAYNQVYQQRTINYIVSRQTLNQNYKEHLKTQFQNLLSYQAYLIKQEKQVLSFDFQQKQGIIQFRVFGGSIDYLQFFCRVLLTLGRDIEPIYHLGSFLKQCQIAQFPLEVKMPLDMDHMLSYNINPSKHPRADDFFEMPKHYKAKRRLNVLKHYQSKAKLSMISNFYMQ